MNNLTIFLIFAIVNFALISLGYRFFGKRGILGYIILSVIAANLQVNKGVMFDFGVFELEATLGNVMFAGIFLATDLLNEKYGAKEARNAVYISIFANLSFIAVMFISTLFQGMDYSTDFNNALEMFFAINGGTVKAVLIGNAVYFVSQSLDVYVYARIRRWNDSMATLWIRNNGSTLVSQFVDTLLVSFGFALAGIFPMEIVGSVIVTTLIVKYITALVDTPFMYLMNMMDTRSKEQVTETL